MGGVSQEEKDKATSLESDKTFEREFQYKHKDDVIAYIDSR